MYRRLSAYLLLLVLAFAIAACGGDDDDGDGDATTPAGGATATQPAGDGGDGGDEPSGEPIRLGVLLPLSGALASAGQEGQRGADLAVKLINESGGVLGRPLELVYKDDQGSTDGNINRLRELADEDVLLTFGYISSAQCVGTAPIAEQLGLLMMSSYCQTNRMIGENFFRATTSAEMLTRAGALAVVQEEVRSRAGHRSRRTTSTATTRGLCSRTRCG